MKASLSAMAGKGDKLGKASQSTVEETSFAGLRNVLAACMYVRNDTEARRKMLGMPIHIVNPADRNGLKNSQQA